MVFHQLMVQIKAFRITGAGSTGSISNYMISGSQSSGEGIDVEGTEFEVGSGVVTGYGTSIVRAANHGYLGFRKTSVFGRINYNTNCHWKSKCIFKKF